MVQSTLPESNRRFIFPSMHSSVDAVLAAGRAAWTSIELDRETLARQLKAHEERGNAVPLEYAADYYLACACVQRLPAATRALDELLTRDVRSAVARIDARPAFVDDALQVLREKLLTGDAPKIGECAGRSTLRRWLGTAATRTALNLRRGKDNESRQELASAIGDAASQGADIAYARERYRDAFSRALRSAVEELSERERALFRMNLVEGMGVDRLSRVYGCGRSTVARWLSAARDKLLTTMRAHLAQELGLTASEIESLAATVRADLDVSLSRILRAVE